MFHNYRAHGALSAFFGPIQGEYYIDNMTAGVVSESYHVRCQDTEWLLRIDERNVAELGVDVHNMNLASGYGLSVANRNCRIVSLDPSGSALIREWVAEDKTPWAASELGRVVNNMHSIHDVHPRLSRYSELGQNILALRHTSYDVLLDSLLVEMEALNGWEWLNRFLANDGFLTHGDLKKDNILSVNGEPILIDWDKSGSVSRLADLALCVFHFARESRRPILACSQFLDGYGRASQISIQLLDRQMLALRIMSRVFVLRDFMGSLGGHPRRYQYFYNDVFPKWLRYARIERKLIDSMTGMME